MATKKIELAGIGEVTLVKLARSRSLRLSVSPNGIRVSMPRWTPFSAGSSFALSHAQWIREELAKQNTELLEAGQRIGKLHYLRFEQVLSGQTITNRVTRSEVIVRMKHGEQTSDLAVQTRARTAIIRALKKEAELLLPARLDAQAQKYDLKYSSIGVKLLKRRWGSCSSHQAITFNLYLMELPWEYIDYVIKHELAHTKQMNHGPDFWKLLTSMEPRARDISRSLKRYQPIIGN